MNTSPLMFEQMVWRSWRRVQPSRPHRCSGMRSSSRCGDRVLRNHYIAPVFFSHAHSTADPRHDEAQARREATELRMTVQAQQREITNAMAQVHSSVRKREGHKADLVRPDLRSACHRGDMWRG